MVYLKNLFVSITVLKNYGLAYHSRSV